MNQSLDKVVLLAPLTGPVVPLADVPDPVFAGGMFGDGIAIDPLEGRLVAPCDGVITHLARTGHAVTLQTAEGAEILLHIGIDTVELGGEGFKTRVAQGAQVKAGDLLIEFDQTDEGDPIVFAGDDHTLRFVAPLPGYLSRLGPQLQTVSLVEDGRSGYRLEVRLALLPPDGSDPQPLGEPEVLLRGIAKGAFAYRGVDDQNRPGDWQGEWSDGRRTPSLVRLELQTDGNVAFPMLVAPVRIDPSASRNGFSPGRLPRGPVTR